MTDTDRLAHNASIATDLAALVVLAANRLNVSLREFRGPRRHRLFVNERKRVIAAARAHGFSFPQIGRALNRDHSTVIQVAAGRRHP